MGDQDVLVREYGTPTKSQLETINQLAKRPLTKEEVFTFPDKLAGDMIIPDRYIQIHKSLLNVFKKDAIAGVSMLLDHPWAGLFARPKPAIAYGRTFDSKLKKSDIEGEDWALYADHYIVKGKEIDGISTDSIIASIEDGTFFDTSIGWGADTYECSICSKSYFSCDHWIGQEYDGEICYVIAKPPGFLMENSLVFDGAYPGAGVLSVDGEVGDSGMVIVEDLKGLSPGVSLLHTFSARKGKLLTFARKEDIGKKVLAQGITLSKGGDKYMDEKTLKLLEKLGIEYKEGETKSDDLLKQVVEKWDATVQTIKDSAEPLKVVDTDTVSSNYLTQDRAKEELGREVAADELLKLAKEGDDYLSALKKEAEEWGIRAEGDGYSKDSWNTRFKFMDSTELKAIIETFKKQVEAAISAGRQSDPEAGKDEPIKLEIPDEAYKA